MINNLVIVESPAKAKTIEKFLGKDFTVKSSMGHIRDLAKEGLGIDINNNFKPNYIVPEDKKKTVADLKASAKKAETVWLASDEDREGEAIAWHLSEELKLDKRKTRRIVFHEITKEAILHAVEHHRQIDQNLVNAQQARRILDRLVGFEISPVLWRKVKPQLSAGRVQSVAVRLIVEREREIIHFKSTSAFRVSAVFEIHSKDKKVYHLKAELDERFVDRKKALEFIEHCKNATFSIADIVKKPAKKSPSPPFTTSTLQQEASRKLGFSVSQTMTVAQRLYEAGLITYMRTDSVNLSNTALKAAEEIITK
jgi:DNA topoisomerase-1